MHLPNNKAMTLVLQEAQSILGTVVSTEYRVPSRSFAAVTVTRLGNK
jgi:hypothetical protein